MTPDALLTEDLEPAFDLMQHGLDVINAAASDRHRAVVDAVIAELASSGRVFSCNDLRPLIGDVPSKLIAPRLRVAKDAGLIAATGESVPSLLRSTHGKGLSCWRGVAS